MKTIICMSCLLLLWVSGCTGGATAARAPDRSSPAAAAAVISQTETEPAASLSLTDVLATTDSAESEIGGVSVDSCPHGTVSCTRGCCAPRGACRQICGH